LNEWTDPSGEQIIIVHVLIVCVITPCHLVDSYQLLKGTEVYPEDGANMFLFIVGTGIGNNFKKESSSSG
jgi:hypothetical protein